MKILSKRLSDPFVQLFWKTQINILRACPPLCGLVSRLTFNAYQNRRLYAKGLLLVAAQAPHVLLLHLRDKRENRVVLPRVSLIVTTRCTLHCDKCLGHCPDMEDRDTPTADLLRDIQTLYSCVDTIYDITITGGETFLHPDLDQIVRACAATGKAGNINLITNGTVVPGAKVLAALRETKATVKISRYPAALQPKVEQLKSLLEENDIRYFHEIGTSWVDTGTFGQLKDGSAQRRFSLCVLKLGLVCCWGKLHMCGESAVLTTEGLIPDCKEDYIDLRSINTADFRGQLKKLLKRPTVSACSYCLGQTYKTPKIPVAVQRIPPSGPPPVPGSER